MALNVEGEQIGNIESGKQDETKKLLMRNLPSSAIPTNFVLVNLTSNAFSFFYDSNEL